MARRLAATLMKCKAEETFSGVFLNTVKGVGWLFTSAYAELVSEGDFDQRALLIGNTTVFLNISLRTLETTPPTARVLVGALLNTVYMADGWTRGRILFLLDEAAQLGRMKTLETARDIGRKYGVPLHVLFQSVGQMAEGWGREGTRAWIDAAAWIGYAASRAGGSRQGSERPARRSRCAGMVRRRQPRPPKALWPQLRIDFARHQRERARHPPRADRRR